MVTPAEISLFQSQKLQADRYMHLAETKNVHTAHKKIEKQKIKHVNVQGLSENTIPRTSVVPPACMYSKLTCVAVERRLQQTATCLGSPSCIFRLEE
jgi:hypothetical protein